MAGTSAGPIGSGFIGAVVLIWIVRAVRPSRNFRARGAGQDTHAERERQMVPCGKDAIATSA